MLLKYKDEYYHVSEPHSLGNGKYTCTAIRDRTGKQIRDPKALNEMGRKLIRIERGKV